MSLLLEMAAFAKGLKCDRESSRFDLELHGGDDRIYPPHVHIYKQKTNHKIWTIEVNLAEYLSTGIVEFCRILANGKKYSNSTECLRFKGRYIFIDFFEEHIVEKPTEKEYINCRDNLEAAIRIFAKEADMTQLHAEDKKRFTKQYGSLFTSMRPEYKLMFTMISMKKKISKKYQSYFDKTLIKLFPEAFE